MNIDKFSKEAGISKRMLRYYEEQALLLPKREGNGYRQYSNDNLMAARVIKLLVEWGLKVKEIKDVFENQDTSILKKKIEARIEEVNQDISLSQDLSSSLHSILSELNSDSKMNIKSIIKLNDIDESQKDLSGAIISANSFISGQFSGLKAVVTKLNEFQIDLSKFNYLYLKDWAKSFGAQRAIVLTGKTFYVPCLLIVDKDVDKTSIGELIDYFLQSWNEHKSEIFFAPRYDIPNVQHVRRLYGEKEIIAALKMEFGGRTYELMIPFRELHSLTFRSDVKLDMYKEYEGAVSDDFFNTLPESQKLEWISDISQLEKLHF